MADSEQEPREQQEQQESEPEVAQAPEQGGDEAAETPQEPASGVTPSAQEGEGEEAAKPEEDAGGGGEGEGEGDKTEQTPEGDKRETPEGEEGAVGEAETEEQKQEEGEGEGDGEGQKAEEEEEKITITHEDNPNWLSTEDCLARGVAEEHVSLLQHTYFQHCYTIKTWYESLSEHTFTTEFISLSAEEVDVLLAASHPGQADQPELSDDQKELLEQIEKKLNDAIEKFEGDGGFIRVNDRNPTDSILERNDAEFVAKIRDAVINELEVFKQSANAYLIWHEQERQGMFRRGMTRLRNSFRRQRVSSASSSRRERPAKLEDTTDQEKDKEEDTPAETQVKDGEGEGEGEGEGGEKGEGDGKGEGEGEKREEAATVTVEVEVQDSDDKTEADPPAQEEAPAPEPEPQQQQQAQEGQEGGEEQTEVTEVEKKDEDEIQKAPEQEAEKKQSPKRKREEHPQIRKAVKSESLDNEVLRAFGRAVTATYRVASGKEALDMLLRSGLTKQYLEQLKLFGAVEGLSATISVTRFHADIARYPGMVFRGFVYEGELTALSQKHDDITFFPNVAQYKNIVQYKVKQFYTQHVKEALAERGNYIIDLFVSAEKVHILRLSPFYTGIGACLFTWAEHAKTLTQGPLEFKIIESPRKTPDLYSGLQSQWNSMLDSVLQQKQNENRSQGIRGACTIL